MRGPGVLHILIRVAWRRESGARMQAGVLYVPLRRLLSLPPLLGPRPFSEIRAPDRKLASELRSETGQFFDPIFVKFQIVGVPHHVTKSLQFTHGSHAGLRNEGRSDPWQGQCEALDQALVVIALLVEVIFKVMADSLENLL